MLVSCDYFKPIGQTNVVKFSDLQVVNYLENAMIYKEFIMNNTIQSFLDDYLIAVSYTHMTLPTISSV